MKRESGNASLDLVASISRLNSREWIETLMMRWSFTSFPRISRLNSREWIETFWGHTTTSRYGRISRLNSREWIETLGA